MFLQFVLVEVITDLVVKVEVSITGEQSDLTYFQSGREWLETQTKIRTSRTSKRWLACQNDMLRSQYEGAVARNMSRGGSKIH